MLLVQSQHFYNLIHYLSWWQFHILLVDQIKDIESILDSSISNLSWSPVGSSNFNIYPGSDHLSPLPLSLWFNQLSSLKNLNSCNSLPTNLLASSSIFSRAARVVLSKCKSGFVTLLPKTLQWLYISLRTKSKSLNYKVNKIWPSLHLWAHLFLLLFLSLTPF